MKLDPQRDAIAVHQMGKVGSTSVFHTLQATIPDLTIYHTHRLNKNTLNYLLRRHLDQETEIAPNLVESLNLLQCLKHKKKRVHIVSLVRDPVSRNISGFFENFELWEKSLSPERRDTLKKWLASKPNAADPLPPEILDVCLGLQDIFFKEYGHQIPLSWIDYEIKEPLGVDLYEKPFDKARGYQEYNFGELRILFLTLEKLNETMPPALASFFGLPSVKVVQANVGEQKYYAPLYKQFIRSVPLPDSYLDEMYSSKMARYFYDDATLEGFRQRWTQRGKKKEAAAKPAPEVEPAPPAPAPPEPKVAHPPMNEELKKEEAALLKRHPVPHEIFLPSEKISPEDRVEGIRKVLDLYENRFEPHREKMREIRKKYLGTQRCFIIGNGPSLNHTDLTKLKDEVTFGLNGIFLLYDKLGFRPTFYVVEDHLVAEDRAEAINSLTGSTKIFPVHLRYCIEEGPETVWIEAKTRTRFREGNYDFSTDASKNTYMGCTVTFTALQLAFYFGFKEIYLVGVDSNYDIPKDVAISRDYSVQTLDMKSDDPNHFHPDYFGKGFRWHDPQVDRMICAYEKARDVSREHGTLIFNATKGGKLESFPRVDYDSLFPPKKADAAVHYPKTLVVDLTEIGGESATGQLKASLFRGWEPNNLMQIFRSGRKHIVVRGEERIPVRNLDDLARLIRQFGPEVVYARPVDLVPEFFDFLEELISDLKVPSVVHIMDDWPERLLHTDRELHDQLIPRFSRMLTQATTRLSISDAMSEAFGERYEVPFTAIANGVDPREWPDVVKKPRERFLLRYSGSLAPDMGRDSVIAVAQLVHELNTSGKLALDFEIYTNKGWMEKEEFTFRSMKGVSLKLFVPREEYSQLLTQADAVLLAYNFDEETVRYIRYSLANKLPDSLASGSPVIAFGPDSINTIATLKSIGVGLVASSIDEVREHLLSLATDEERKNRIGRAARCWVFQNLHINKTKEIFRTILQEAAETRKQPYIAGPCFKDEGKRVDEVKLACAFMKAADGKEVLISENRSVAEKITNYKIKTLQTESLLAQLDKPDDSGLILALDEWEVNEPAISKFLASSPRQRALILRRVPQEAETIRKITDAGFQVLGSVHHGKTGEFHPWGGLRTIDCGPFGDNDSLMAFYPPIAEEELKKRAHNFIGDDDRKADDQAKGPSFADASLDVGKPMPKLPLAAAAGIPLLFVGGAFFAFNAAWGAESLLPGVVGGFLGLLFSILLIGGYVLAREISIVRLKIQRLSLLSDRRKTESAKHLATQLSYLRSSQERIHASLADLRNKTADKSVSTAFR